MPAEKGSAFLLKVGDGAQPVFATVAGMGLARAAPVLRVLLTQILSGR